MTAERNGPIDILLVEDNPGDERLTREALKEGKVYSNLHWAKDGVEALDFLRRTGKYGAAPRPDIILLDLNLPKKDGREVLAEIKKDEQLKRIPVVILTTSKADIDIAQIYDLGANSFISKPVTFDSLVKVMRILGDYWCQTVELPPKQAA
jgi:CheY-like chemotaxis protein